LTFFRSGEEMIEQLQVGAPPSALVLDWYMPTMSGLDVCQFVRTSFGATELPIIILTGTSNREDLVAGLRAGANDYVTKPFDGEELTARLESLVERGRLEREQRDLAAFQERFVAILGHDLRQPLNAFAIGTQMLLTQDLDAQHAKTVRLLARASERMRRMIEDLLDLTRSRQGGGLPIHRRPASLGDVCRNVVEELQTSHASRDIVLKVLDECSGEWDRDRISQLCANLIGNAIEHGRAGGPIEVSLESAGDNAILSVENDAERIAPDVMAVLFDPFRGARAGSKGLGLGLFIAQQIAAGHDGTLEVTSEERVTRFAAKMARFGKTRQSAQ
jgi:signal transduction histidine kinase